MPSPLDIQESISHLDIHRFKAQIVLDSPIFKLQAVWASVTWLCSKWDIKWVGWMLKKPVDLELKKTEARIRILKASFARVFWLTTYCWRFTWDNLSTYRPINKKLKPLKLKSSSGKWELSEQVWGRSSPHASMREKNKGSFPSSTPPLNLSVKRTFLHGKSFI